MKKFTVQWVSFILIIVALSLFLQKQLLPAVVFVHIYWWLLGFMAAMSWISFTIVHYANLISSETGVQGMVLAIGVKLFLSMILILIIAKKLHLDKILFMSNFFSLYFLFSLFEIKAMLRNLRHQNSRKKS